VRLEELDCRSCRGVEARSSSQSKNVPIKSKSKYSTFIYVQRLSLHLVRVALPFQGKSESDHAGPVSLAPAHSLSLGHTLPTSLSLSLPLFSLSRGGVDISNRL
jgi:hypothetical protein